jgi:hypothetical protein
MIYKTKQDLQRSVDSAALAGAYKLPKKPVAIQATSEFMRLHGYTSSPCGNPLDGLSPCNKTQPYLEISFPNEAVQKLVHVEASTNASYFFLRVLGFNTMTVSAAGEGEAAPMDVYLVFDLSESMVYDTKKPSPWPDTGSDWKNSPDYCTDWDSSDYHDCIAKWCNFRDKCAPLDITYNNGNPVIGIKGAANFFIDQLDPRYDRVGVVSYAQEGVQVIGLSADYNAVKAKINALNAFDHQGPPYTLCPNDRWDDKAPSSYRGDPSCAKQTNIGDGIMVAHSKIALPYDPITKTGGGRIDSIWSVVLLTDGIANAYRECSGCPPNCGASACNTIWLCYIDSGTLCDDSYRSYNAIDWAIDNAKDTWTRHETVIYTIGYGQEFIDYPAAKNLLKNIADWTDNGIYDNKTENFFQAPDVDSLKQAFVEIAQRIYARLLQ